MKNSQELVKEFHRKFELLVNESPIIPNNVNILTCLTLIHEELSELTLALHPHYFYNTKYNPDMIEVTDALGDLLYVVLGMATRFGIEMAPMFEEIHRSNMTKIGGHINEAGKYIKSGSYDPPKLEEILIKQGWKKGE